MSQSRQYFSQLEKSLLTELVAKHKDVLESKRNDFRTISQKNALWETLSQEYNSQSGVTKWDAKQLKKGWVGVVALFVDRGWILGDVGSCSGWVQVGMEGIGDGVVCWVITTEDDILGYWRSVVSIRSDMGVCVSDGDKLSGVATE